MAPASASRTSTTRSACCSKRRRMALCLSSIPRCCGRRSSRTSAVTLRARCPEGRLVRSDATTSLVLMKLAAAVPSPSRILELGSYRGYSAQGPASRAHREPGTRLTAVDIDPQHGEAYIGWHAVGRGSTGTSARSSSTLFSRRRAAERSTSCSSMPITPRPRAAARHRGRPAAWSLRGHRPVARLRQLGVLHRTTAACPRSSTSRRRGCPWPTSSAATSRCTGRAWSRRPHRVRRGRARNRRRAWIGVHWSSAAAPPVRLTPQATPGQSRSRGP